MKKDRDAVIVSLARSAIGDLGGSLASLRAHQLAAQVMRAVLSRVDLDPRLLDDVVLGDVCQCPDEANTARTALLLAGFPVEVPAVTIQRQCSSAMQALGQSAQAIRAGDADLILTGGVESLSSAPYVSYQMRQAARLSHLGFNDAIWDIFHSGSTLLAPPGYIMGQTGENIARKFGLGRQEQDAIALRSHQNAEAAIKGGRFKEEITPVQVVVRNKTRLVELDEHVRFGLTLAELAKLKPAFAEDGTVTAGNACGLNDGAAMCLLASRNQARRLGLKPLAKVHSFAVAGCDPALMGLGPVASTQKLFARTGVSLADIDLVEINEAFASQYLAVEMSLGLDRERTNVNGSGIALGHPVGCTGTRIVISLLGEMKRRGNGLGLAALCAGGGIGMSMLIENE